MSQLVVIARWRAKPGEERRWRPRSPRSSRSRAPSRAWSATRSTATRRIPHVFTIYERYRDAAAYEAHLESEPMQRLGFGDAIPRLEEPLARVPRAVGSHGLGRPIAAIWIRLPQVSSSTAVVTGPISAGSWVKRTPSAREALELGAGRRRRRTR